MDRQYRIIPIYLTGNTSTHLYATQRDSGRSFIYKIEDLHFINQWRMYLYPSTFNLGKSEEYTNFKSHAEQTLVARDRLIEAAKKLQAKIEATESNVLVRSFDQELAGELQKIFDLETRIDN